MRNKGLKNLICTRQVKCKGKWQGILKSLSNWMVEQKLFRAVKDGKFWRDIWKTHRTKNENMESENKCKMSWITHSLLPFVRQNYARWDELWPYVTELLDWFFFFFSAPWFPKVCCIIHFVRPTKDDIIIIIE